MGCLGRLQEPIFSAYRLWGSFAARLYFRDSSSRNRLSQVLDSIPACHLKHAMLPWRARVAPEVEVTSESSTAECAGLKPSFPEAPIVKVSQMAIANVTTSSN